ncbi:hypothetical protein GQ600_17144 [Phytophthora cactorum]|nr:hypothetical protein GQ600_17144 [Phytophthora cactorum]
MVSTNDESPCGGCGDGVGDVHVCPEYSPHMRPFCGAPVGKEGYGQSVLCPKCESEFGVPPRLVVAYRSRVSTPDSGGAAFLSSSSVDNFARYGQRRRQRQREYPSHRPRSVCRGKARKATTTILNRKKVVRCMLVQEELSGIKGLMAAAVEKFHAISMLARGTQISLKLHFGGSRKKTFYTEEEGHRRFRLVGTRGANT